MKTNIDPNAIYKATKTTIKDDTKFRYVDRDFNIIGQAEIIKSGENSHLTVGDLVTSPVLKVTQDGDNFIIETKNSVYTLEKMS
jgi:hypothetical protein